jgi:hypothetical protein
MGRGGPGLTIHVRFVTATVNTQTITRAKSIIADCIVFVDTLLKIRRAPVEYDNLYITLLDIDAPKVVRWADTPDPTNVNTGFTWGDMIYVYRHEEMCKVLIHELVHYWNFHLPSLPDKEQQARAVFRVSDLNFNEGYVDSLAVVLYTSLMSLKTGKQFKELWDQQYDHVMYQALCVSMNYLAVQQSHIGDEIKEKTNTMSYYVVKAALYSAKKSYWDLLTSGDVNYSLTGNIDATRQFYDILLYQITDTKSDFWKRLRQVHKQRGVCRDGDTMAMTRV